MNNWKGLHSYLYSTNFYMVEVVNFILTYFLLTEFYDKKLGFEYFKKKKKMTTIQETMQMLKTLVGLRSE